MFVVVTFIVTITGWVLLVPGLRARGTALWMILGTEGELGLQETVRTAKISWVSGLGGLTLCWASRGLVLFFACHPCWEDPRLGGEHPHLIP